MKKKTAVTIEFCTGLFFIIFGVLVWFWSRNLKWILIYPPPLVKYLIEILSFVCFGLGILMVLDGLRKIKNQVI